MEEKRFLGTVLVKAIAQTIFRKRGALALGNRKDTSLRFEVLTGPFVAYIATCIRHTLSEYVTGVLLTLKFDGPEIQGNLLKLDNLDTLTLARPLRTLSGDLGRAVP